GTFLDDLYLQNPHRRLFNQYLYIRTRQFYVQDSMRFLDDRLTVDVGIKSPNTRMRATAQPGGETSIASGTLTAKESVLPQLGVG
ncbi:hypothetical protein P8631_20700, partial [Guyparkeria sp. 1SP6A2]|nr:hypothetical protein [Guyparkeria sp. 1SP6A2]